MDSRVREPHDRFAIAAIADRDTRKTSYGFFFFADLAGEADGATGTLAGDEATGVVLPAGKTPAPESGAGDVAGED